ncbi:MAG TPA: hypothetical protein VJ326_10175 [Thermoplasmata archaeon]|nr:hypothetical protein [Thermoplasmata archaeon]
MDPHEFARSLHEGADRERAMHWEEAAAFYAGLVRGLGSIAAQDARGRAMRAMALLRQGNALMELARWEEARQVLDDALHDAQGSGDAGVVAQALLAAGVFAANRADAPRAEAFMLDALERFHATDDRASLQGRGWAFLNLATLYGKTGRIDLAFVTFHKARDVLGAARNWAGVAAAWEAQAQLRRGMGDEDRWREDLAEAVIFYERDGMREKADRLRAVIGRKLV